MKNIVLISLMIFVVFCYYSGIFEEENVYVFEADDVSLYSSMSLGVCEGDNMYVCVCVCVCVSVCVRFRAHMCGCV